MIQTKECQQRLVLDIGGSSHSIAVLEKIPTPPTYHIPNPWTSAGRTLHSIYIAAPVPQGSLSKNRNWSRQDMADFNDFPDLLDFDGDFDSDFDVLGKDFLSGELSLDLSGGDIDLFGEPLILQPPEQKSSTPIHETPASPATAVSTGAKSNVESSTVSPRAPESSQAVDPPRSAPTSPSKQSPSPRAPQSTLPPGRSFAPVPQHLLVRKCSPPSNTLLPPSSIRPQARVLPSTSGFPQRTQFISPNAPMAGYTSMGPPPPGPLNVRRYAPVALMTAPTSGGMAPTPSKKRKTDAIEEPMAEPCNSVDDLELSAASDTAGEGSPAKRRRLEQRKQEVAHTMDDRQRQTAGSTEGQAMDLFLKGRQDEALVQANDYRRLRDNALEQAAEYKRLGTNAIQRYNYHREKRRQLRG